MNIKLYKSICETSPVVQWLKLCLPMQGGVGSIPGLGAKVPHVQPKVKNK